ncbi:UNKNOWN [Stylonychia lemnae]|uniref:Uncharacterized protein n=1 Tax=Stylonychia lemnae TaxID=5949 RepID=A0A078AIJ5_STYLE|nr:UNKNOWN [Stylonychia lemnae]|eukprot:CDW80633.1 UNKNOWN [Stylonychia lemnae]
MKPSKSVVELKNAGMFKLPSISHKIVLNQNIKDPMRYNQDLKAFDSENINKSKMTDYISGTSITQSMEYQQPYQPNQVYQSPIVLVDQLKKSNEVIQDPQSNIKVYMNFEVDLSQQDSQWKVKLQRSQSNAILQPLQNQQYTRYKQFQMALRNENKVNRPLYVKDSSKVYDRAKDEDKIRSMLKDMKFRKNSHQVGFLVPPTQLNIRTNLRQSIDTSKILNDQSAIIKKTDESTMQSQSILQDLIKVEENETRMSQNKSQLTMRDLGQLSAVQDKSNILRIKRDMISQAVKEFSQKPQKSGLAEFDPSKVHRQHLQEVKLNLKHAIQLSQRSQLQDINTNIERNINQLDVDAYHKINEYIEHLKNQQEKSEQPNIKIIEIIKAYMKEMVRAFIEEQKKSHKSELEHELEENLGMLRELINSPQKLKKKQLELLMKQVSDNIFKQSQKDLQFVVNHQELLSPNRKQQIEKKVLNAKMIQHQQEHQEQEDLSSHRNVESKKQYIDGLVSKTLDSLQNTKTLNKLDIIEQVKKDSYCFKNSKEFFETIKMGDVIKTLRFLKENDGYANDLDRLQRTPLSWACQRGFDKVVQILIDYGAELDTLDSFGRTAKDLAIQKENPVIVNFLKQVEAGKYARSTDKYTSAIYIKTLLPPSRMDEVMNQKVLSQSKVIRGNNNSNNVDIISNQSNTLHLSQPSPISFKNVVGSLNATPLNETGQQVNSGQKDQFNGNPRSSKQALNGMKIRNSMYDNKNQTNIRIDNQDVLITNTQDTNKNLQAELFKSEFLMFEQSNQDQPQSSINGENEQSISQTAILQTHHSSASQSLVKMRTLNPFSQDHLRGFRIYDKRFHSQNLKKGNYSTSNLQFANPNLNLQEDGYIQEQNQPPKIDYKDFMMNKISDKHQTNIEILKKQQHKDQVLTKKYASGYFTASKFIRPERNVMLLDPKKQKYLDTTEKKNMKYFQKVYEEVKKDSQFKELLEQPIVKSPSKNQLLKIQSQKTIIPAIMPDQSSQSSHVKAIEYKGPFSQPAFYLTDPDNYSEIHNTRPTPTPLSINFNDFNSQGHRRQQSRNQMIDIDDLQMTATQNTISDSKTSFDKNKIEKIITPKNKKNSKNSWSIVDHMYKGAITSPMNQFERIKTISQMSKIQSQATQQLKFNQTSKVQLKYLINHEKNHPIFDNFVDKDKQIIKQKHSQEYQQLGEVLGTYIKQSQILQRPESKQNLDLIAYEDGSQQNGADYQIQLYHDQSQSVSAAKLQGILQGHHKKFFDSNFALKEKESENLKIEFNKLQTEAHELKSRQIKDEILDRNIQRQGVVSSKAKKLIDLIMRY